MKANDLSSLVTLKTLSVLKILKERKAEMSTMLADIISITENNTMIPSKSFMGSLTYPPGPSAVTLIISSIMKIQV